jgi:Tol biopolymer transport system component
LTTGPGPDESPTVATTGEVAFVNSRWRNGLFVHDIDRGDSRLLLTHSPFLWAPAFSPDAQELAFSRGEVDGQWHIWLISTAGGTARQLTSGALGEVYATFTADGRSILYHTWNAPRRIWQLPRAGGPAVPLTADGLDATFGQLSPDGRALVFVVTEEGRGERVYTQPAQGGSPQLLTASPASTPRWSPDGEWIAFAADRGYGGGISIIRPGGSQERRLTETGGWPAWRSDGRHISYAVVTPDGRQQIETVAIDGAAAATPVGFRFEGTNFPFVFSPNGRTMATSNSIHVSDEIWLLQPEE